MDDFSQSPGRKTALAQACGPSAQSRPRDDGSRPVALVTVLLVFLLLAFSEEFLNAVLDTRRWWLLAATDAVLFLLVLLLARWTRRQTSTGGVRRAAGFSWFAAAAALTLALDFAWGEWSDAAPHVAILLLLAYVPPLFMLVCYVLAVNPWRVFRAAHDGDAEAKAQRDDVIAALPLLVGTAAAYVGQYLYFEALQSPVDHEYFAQVVQVIPLLLIALGLEAQFFSIGAGMRPVRWAMTVYGIVVLVVAEALALAALPADPDKEQLFAWHEYIALTTTLYACFLALAALVIVLVAGLAEATPERRRRLDGRARGTRGVFVRDRSNRPHRRPT